ncbi:hypothetical protein ACJX0J_037044, partial [Zea mays]
NMCYMTCLVNIVLLPASAFRASSELVEIVVELVVVAVLVAHQALIPSNHNLLHTRIVEYTSN